LPVRLNREFQIADFRSAIQIDLAAGATFARVGGLRFGACAGSA
jgi:hypothetical protein